MKLLLLLSAILIPVLGSLFVIREREDHDIEILTMFLVLATSAVVWYLIMVMDPTECIHLIHFTDTLILELKFDLLGKFFAGIVATLYPLTTLYAFEYLEEDHRKNVFFMFFLIAYGVTIGVCMSGNFFTLYCFYELLTLSTMPLVLHENNKQSVRAARTYLLLSIGGAALAFMSMVYFTTMGTIERNTLTQLFYLIGFFGFGVKAAVFPVHYWLPKASVAPTPVTALLHAVAVVKSGIFAIIRLTYFIYGVENVAGSFAQYIALGFAIFTIFYGASKAVKETHTKRRMAYSTVANLSYILFGVLLMTQDGLTAGLLHMCFHAEIKILAFFAVGAVMHHTGREYMWEIDGLGKRMPVTYGCYTVAALALTGIPPFAGFVSKAYLLLAGFRSGMTLGTIGSIVLLVSALLTAIYALTPTRRAFFPDKDYNAEGLDEITEVGWRMKVPMVILAIGIVVTGFLAAPILRSAAAVAISAVRWIR